MPLHLYSSFKHRALLESNHVFLPDTALIEQIDSSDLDARLEATLPYLPKRACELFCCDEVFIVGKGTPDERATIGFTLCKQEPYTIFLSSPKEGYKVIATPEIRFVPETQAQKRSTTRAQHQSLLPFLYWHEKIEATVSSLVDPENRMDFELYNRSPSIHRIMEALADCFAGNTVVMNRDFYAERDLDPIPPLASVMGKALTKELERYYTPLIEFMQKTPDDVKTAEALFNKYVNAAKAQAGRLLHARPQESVE